MLVKQRINNKHFQHTDAILNANLHDFDRQEVLYLFLKQFVNLDTREYLDMLPRLDNLRSTCKHHTKPNLRLLDIGRRAEDKLYIYYHHVLFDIQSH